MSQSKTPMSAVDRSWLRMDSPTNPMMISAVLVFDQPIAINRLKRTLNERFLCFQRFRQRVIHEGERVYWQDDPLFDIDNHIHRIALPGNAGKDELQALTSDLNSTSLDLRRPLWQIHYIDNYGGGCALLIRIHHCIADGISLVRVLLSLTDKTPEAKLSRLSMPPMLPTVTPGSSLRRFTNRVLDSGQAALEQSQLFIQSLRQEPDYPLKLATTAGNIAMDLVKLGLAPFEPRTGLRSPLCGRKQVAWAEPLSLAEVKLCGRALRGSVNDVLLCAATGALQRHFRETGEHIPDCGIRVAVPFNLRPLRQPIETLGNQFGLVLVSLPVEVNDPVMRFRQVQENMNRPGHLQSAGPVRPRPGYTGAARAGASQQQGLRRAYQRAWPEGSRLSGWRQTGSTHVLGAAKRQHRYRYEHLQLRRHGAIRDHHRPQYQRRSRCRHGIF
ncbi:unnamed protein product, partial [Ectocarpus sp. 12 AP-2014]